MRMSRVCAAATVAASLVLMASPVSAVTPEGRPAVVGGAPIAIAESPWQVLVLIGAGNRREMCSGSLISPSTVLTAAHCLSGVDPGTVKVWTGVSTASAASDSKAISASGLVVHPGYDSVSLANDIALIQLVKPVDVTNDARVIGLPVAQDAGNWPAAGTPALISGWGATSTNGPSSDPLLRATVQVLSGPGGPCGQYGPSFNSTMLICGGLPDGSVDTCQGDSGGPLVVDVAGVPILAGLTSNGVECASAAFPGLYTRVSTFIPWIQQAADVATSAPGQPTGVTATSSRGTSTISWNVPSGPGAGSTVWTVTAQPGGSSCRTTSNACVVAGLKAGTPTTYTVQGVGPLGSGPAATSDSIVVATHSARRGTAISLRSLGSWVGLRGGTPRAVSRSKSICVVAGGRVKLLEAGNCSLVLARGGSRRPVTVTVT
jgi:trypsin